MNCPDCGCHLPPSVFAAHDDAVVDLRRRLFKFEAALQLLADFIEEDTCRHDDDKAAVVAAAKEATR